MSDAITSFLNDPLPVLTGARLTLRAPEPEDVARRAVHAPSDAILAGFGTCAADAPPMTQKVAAEWIGQMEQARSWLMLDGDALIGAVRLHTLYSRDLTALIAIGLVDPAALSRGYGREAMELVLDFAFEELGLHRVGLRALASNARALKLYRALGFAMEGRAREAALTPDGRVDDVHMGLLARDWLGLRDGALRLRPIRQSDVPAMVAGLNDFEVSKWTANIPHPFTAADLRLTDADGAPEWPDKAVIELDGVCVGSIRVDGRIGYWLSAKAQGRGVMTRAAQLMLTAFFARRPEAQEVTACVFEGNPASSRILEKLGFEAGTGACTGHSLARGEDLPQVNYRLTRAAWEGQG